MTDERLNLPSASSFHIVARCPGQPNLLRQVPPAPIDSPELSEAAERGRRIHHARAAGNTLDLNEDELLAYQEACRLEQQLVERWQADQNIEVVGDPIHGEGERLFLHHPETGRPILSGEFDLLYLVGRKGLLIDFKSGSATYVEPAKRNFQMRVYALLARNEYDLKEIRCALIKMEAFGQRLDWVDYTEFDLERIEQTVFNILWQSWQEDAPRTAGSWCTFCKCRGCCPEAATYSLLPTVQRNPDGLNVATMPIEDCLAVWKRKSEVVKILDAITARLAAAKDDHARLGLKLTAGKKLDRVKDKLGAFNALRQAGWSSQEIVAAMEFSKTALCDTHRARSGCAKDAADGWFDTMLDEYIERGRSNPSIVSVGE